MNKKTALSDDETIMFVVMVTAITNSAGNNVILSADCWHKVKVQFKYSISTASK